MYRHRILYPYGLIIFFGIILFIPFLGGVHLFDWDEINFAESAREMIITNNYLDVQINYQRFWEKPPLFIWMQVLSMKLFGINEFAARFPNALCGVISLMVIFFVGRRFRDDRFGWLWVLAYTGSVLPFFYFKSGIIDPWFNLFIFTAIVSFSLYLYDDSYRLKKLGLSALLLGLAILTKGPVALLIFILSFALYLIYKKFKINTGIRDILFFTAILILSGGMWFILQILTGNYQVLQDFINYQVRLFSTEDAGHGGFFLYHFVMLFVGVFPSSVFAISGFIQKEKDNFGLRLWMFILFWTVLILFTVVRTKIVHYSSLCYFPLTFFAAVFLYKLTSENHRLISAYRIILLCLAALYGALLAVLPLIERYKVIILDSGWIKDPFAMGNLQAEVEWTGYEPAFGLIFFLVFWYFLRQVNKHLLKPIVGLFISSILFIFFSILIITPRIEAYSQLAAIEFYKTASEEDAYITTMGFKSYAHLYYGKVKPSENPDSKQLEWLLNGPVDKPAYFVFKINRKERYLREYPQLELLYEKNGFVFTKRTESDKL